MPHFALANLAPVLPEGILAIGALVSVLIGAIGGEKSYTLVRWVAILLMVAAGVLILNADASSTAYFGGAFVADAFSKFMKLATLVGSVVTLVMSEAYLRATGRRAFEYPLLVLISTLAMMLMISAHDLVALYLGLELSSLALYVVASFDRDNVKSTEAGLKYFVLGALSSGMLLYGSSLVYGMTGSVTFDGIAGALKSGASVGMIFGLVFVLAGLAFKISAVPFHMWTPDVYEGAPTPVTAFFAAAPKMAAIALLMRVVGQAFPAIVHEWQQIIIFVALASMILGAFAAIGQANIKRLLAYSSIGHIGFALVGLAAGTPDGIASVMSYMTIYLVTTLGTFACVLAMARGTQYFENIDDLSGLSKTNPALAFAFAMLMFSLAGIPPLAGFFAKWYVFVEAVNAKLYALAIIGVLSSVVGAYYYLRIVKIIYFDEPKDAFSPAPIGVRLIASLSAIIVLIFALAPTLLTNAASVAAKSLF